MTSIKSNITPPLDFTRAKWFPHGGVKASMKRLQETYLDALANPDEYPLFSHESIARMKSGFEKYHPGKSLYPWQELLGIASMLGLDASCIIGTGGGKTVPTILPLYAAKPGERRVVLVIVPLKQLQAEFYFLFKHQMGRSPIVINGDTWRRASVQQKLRDRKFDVILVGPEMCLDEKTFRPLLSDPDFNKHISHATLDEAHLVVLWGREFRKAFDQLSVVRSILPRSVTWLAQSATLNPEMHQQVCKSLCISSTNAFHINLGNDRRNISQVVIRMKRSEDVHARMISLLKGLQLGPTGKLVQAIVFCETRDDTQKASQYMRRYILDENAAARERIQYIHAGRTRQGRATVIKRFIEGRIDILCATECVGLGQNLPGLEVVILARLPRDLCTAIQRIGRVGRDGRPARAYVLAEAAALEKYTRRKPKKVAAKSKSKRPSAPALPPPDIRPTLDVSELAPQDTEPIPDEDSFRKKLDPALRAYLEVPDNECRCDYLNTRFGNPAPATNAGPRPVLCCDLCIKKKISGASNLSRDELLRRTLNALDAHSPLSTHPTSLITSLADVATVSLRKIKEEPVIIAEPRNKLQTLRLHAKLTKLRLQLYCDPNAGYSDSGLSIEALLRTDLIDIIPADRSLTTTDRLRNHSAFLADVDALEFLNTHEDTLIEEINTFTRSVAAEGEAVIKAKKLKDAQDTVEKRQREVESEESCKRQALDIVNVNADAREIQADPSWHEPRDLRSHCLDTASSNAAIIPMLDQALSANAWELPAATSMSTQSTFHRDDLDYRTPLASGSVQISSAASYTPPALSSATSRPRKIRSNMKHSKYLSGNEPQPVSTVHKLDPFANQV